jgi:DNA-binding CsgD family transcriptional regulator
MARRTLRSPATDISTAATAYREARFTDAAALIDRDLDDLAGPTFGEAAILRARIYLKSDPAAAVAFLVRCHARIRANSQRAAAEMLLGVGYARLGDEKTALAKLKSASLLARGDRKLTMEIGYQRAAFAWISRKLDVAERELAAVFPNLEGDTLLEAYVARGAISAARGKIAEQGAILLEATDTLTRVATPGVLPWAIIASQLAYLARELPGTALRDAAHREEARIPWTADLAGIRFTLLRALAWRHALEGDYFNAFRILKEAAKIAPTDAWVVTATTDRAYLATVLNERRWAEQELTEAHELASRVNWRSLDGEESFSLLDLAELYAPIDASLALSYVARYKDAGTRFAATLASRDDRRVGAQESYAFGVVQLALGERSEAQRLLRAAFNVYDAIGYDWRAGRAALALAEATNDGAWRERAAVKLAPYGRSWLSATASTSPTHRHAEHATAAPEIQSLTKAQQAVYELLLRGRSTAEIAAEQQRSEFTVRNHIKAIFKAFGVNSRPALLARASGNDRI